MYKKIIIGITILFLSTNIFAAVNWSRTIQIYEQLIQKNHLKRPNQLRLINSNDINAWVDQYDRVNITTGLLASTTEPELALVIAHELAHVQNNDVYTPDDGRKTKEDRADSEGTVWAKNIGYSQCHQALFFLRLYWKYGNHGDAGDPHSSNLKRFWRIYKQCNGK